MVVVSAIRILPGGALGFPAVEAFPTSLSALRVARLDGNMDEQTAHRLKTLERQLRESVAVSSILEARSKRALEAALVEGFKKAGSYYVESGILAWRALGHDYAKLLQLSKAASEAIEQLFFQHAERLEHTTFTKAVAGLRVLTKVGEWTILSEQANPDAIPPLSYLTNVMGATFLAWCMLAYVTGDAAKARKANLKFIADGMFEFGSVAYHNAIQAKLYEAEPQAPYWYWSPAWQEGEVEADLDKHLGDVQRFDSVEDLLHDLRG